MNILFTSAGRRSYLIRFFKEALGENGVIYAANSNRISTALEVADEMVIVPLAYESEYIPFLLEFCVQKAIDMVIPLLEIDAYILAQNKGLFAERGIQIIVSDSQVLDICNDKWNTYKYLMSNNFPTIPTFISVDDAIETIEKGELAYPVIVKPRWGLGSIAIYEACNNEELRVFYKKCERDIFSTYLKYESGADAEHCVLIQKKMNGREYGVDVIDDLQGNYVTSIIKEKIGMRAGETDCAITIKDVAIKQLTERLAKDIRHIANMDVDIIVENDIPYILELNARFGGGYPFSHIAGVNLPKAIINWVRGEAVGKDLFQYKCGVTAMKEIGMVVLKNEWKEQVCFEKISEIPQDELEKFIREEIDPYLSIPLDKKMTCSMDDYVCKVKERADGWGIRINGELVGVIVAYIRNRVEDNSIFLSMFGVKATMRKKGYGALLLNKLTETIPEGCCIYTTVDEHNDVAWRSYSKAGFVSKYVINGRRTIELVKN